MASPDASLPLGENRRADSKSASVGYSGYIDVGFDGVAGVIRVRGVGMWTPQQAQVYFDEMARLIQPMRASRSPVRAVIDLREAPVQSAATADAMSKGSFSHDPETDRVAFISLSKLFGMQLKRSVPFVNSAIFENEDDALAWVLSDEPGDVC